MHEMSLDEEYKQLHARFDERDTEWGVVPR